MSRPYNQPNTNKGKGKSSMYLKKTFDFDIPQNIMTSISKWLDCYNSTISQLTKIKLEYELDNKINDTNLVTSSIKASNSCKKSQNEKIKHEKDIFTWLSIKEDQDIDYFSTKISNLMYIDKNVIIKNYVDPYRLENNKKVYNPDYKKTFQPPPSFAKPYHNSLLIKPTPKQSTDVYKPSPVPSIVKPSPEIPKVVEKIYKDAWDDHFS